MLQIMFLVTMVMNSWHPSAMIFCPEEFSSTPRLQQKLIDYAGGCVQPGFDNFEDNSECSSCE